MNDLRTAAQQALECLKGVARGKYDGNAAEVCAALRAALAQQAEPVEPWSTRERFYEAVDRAVEAVRQKMKIKTVTMRLPEYDITLPIIDAYSGHVVVGPVVLAPPQRKPLPKQDQHCVDVPGYGLVSVRLVRAVERAHGITDPQIADHLARHGIPMPEGDPK